MGRLVIASYATRGAGGLTKYVSLTTQVVLDSPKGHAYSTKNEGSQSTRSGKSVMRIITATFAARKGAAPRKIVPMPSFEIAAQTLRQLPTGGVQAPTARPDTRASEASLPVAHGLSFAKRGGMGVCVSGGSGDATLFRP